MVELGEHGVGKGKNKQWSGKASEISNHAHICAIHLFSTIIHLVTHPACASLEET